MRNLVKTSIPSVLKDNQVKWTQEYMKDPKNDTNRFRYRHRDVKQALKAETHDKCIYCESKIGHNTPGDVEHVTPSSVDRTKHFDWLNLTIACTECNRRKSNYSDGELPFLDPYVDDVESMITHLGPVVSWNVGDRRAEATLRTLALHNASRIELISRKIERLEDANDKLDRLKVEAGVLKKLLSRQIDEMQDVGSEYSGMVKAAVAAKTNCSAP